MTAALLLGQLAYVHRPRQEIIVILAAPYWQARTLGLLLLGLLRHQNIETVRALAWPFWLYRGNCACVTGRCRLWNDGPRPATTVPKPIARGRVAILAILLVAIVAFSVVWSREQFLTEVLVELVTGGLVLFVGFYWLEGHGLAPKPGPHDNPPTEPIASGAGAPELS